MKKFRLLIAGVIILVLGVGVIAVSIPFGSLDKTVWAGLNRDIRAKKGYYPDPLLKTEEFDAVKILDIDITSNSVVIEKDGTGDLTDKIKIEYYEDFADQYTIDSQTADKLTIREKPFEALDYKSYIQDFTWLIELFVKEDYSTFKITVPNEFEFDGLILKSTSGDIKIESVKADSFTLDATSGNIKIKECSFGKMDLGATSGNINIEDVKADSLDLKATSGNTKINGGDIKKIVLECTSGDVKIGGMANKAADTGFNIKVTGGYVNIEGLKRMESKYESPNFASAEYSVKATLTSGNFRFSDSRLG